MPRSLLLLLTLTLDGSCVRVFGMSQDDRGPGLVDHSPRDHHAGDREDAADRLGPTSESDFYEGNPATIRAGRHDGRYLQYRAFFEARTFASSPVLDRVVIRYR